MARKRSSWWKWLLFLALIAAGVYGWREYGKRASDSPVEYRTNVISRGDITQVVTANGQLSAVKNVTVGSQVSGIITEIHVDFNSRVTNGQLVAQIDPSTYLQNISQAEAELSNARAGLALAEINFRRAQALRTNELIPQSEFDTTRIQVQQAESAVRLREATLKKAQVDLERTTIYAPIDGIVISRAVDVGQTVAASFNAPTLFNIANDLRNMRIEAMVSEADVGGVDEGQQVNFTVDAFPGRQFRGTVTQVRFAPVTNQNVVTYTAVVDVNNADLKLRPGMTANASIITAQARGVLRIPNAALRFRPPQDAVVLQDGPATDTGQKQVKLVEAGPLAGLPEPPWMAEGRRRPNPGEREQWEASLTPEQRERAQAAFAEMRARFAQGGGGERGGGGGAPRSAAPEGPRSQTVYLIQQTSDRGGKPSVAFKSVTIRLGITDGNFTEVTQGLNEGDVVATGIVTTEPAQQNRMGGAPFGGSPFGGPPRIR